MVVGLKAVKPGGEKGFMGGVLMIVS